LLQSDRLNTWTPTCETLKLLCRRFPEQRVVRMSDLLLRLSAAQHLLTLCAPSTGVSWLARLP
jgi:hypothetical protein